MWGNFWAAICMNYDDEIFTTELQTQFCTRGGVGMDSASIAAHLCHVGRLRGSHRGIRVSGLKLESLLVNID